MCKPRRMFVVALFLCLSVVVTSLCCRNHKKSGVSPNWEIWNDPSMVLALDETDPQGDDLGYGAAADLSEMQGTYDGSYVYIHMDVYSTPVIDDSGTIQYGLVIDGNNTGDFEPGDYTLAWDGVNGLRVYDYEGRPVSGFGFYINPAGGIDFSIPRHLVNQTAFGVSAGVMCWDGTGYQEGDDMPPYPAWATFIF